MAKLNVSRLVVVKELKRTPKDIGKFVGPEQATRVLGVLLDAIKQARPDTRWHFHVKIRYAVPVK